MKKQYTVIHKECSGWIYDDLKLAVREAGSYRSVRGSIVYEIKQVWPKRRKSNGK